MDWIADNVACHMLEILMWEELTTHFICFVIIIIITIVIVIVITIMIIIISFPFIF